MKSKIKSPVFVETLKSGAYKTRLKAELQLLTASKEPQRFLLSLDHKFADTTELLLVVNYSTEWKEFKKTQKASVDFASGHCELANGKLSLSIERGKARDRAIITAFKKHAVLKHYELELELNEADVEEAEIDNMTSQIKSVKLKDVNSKETFTQIQVALSAFRAVATHEFVPRQNAMEKLQFLIKNWHNMHPKPTSVEDQEMVGQLLKITNWLKKQAVATDTKKDHAAGYKLIDQFVKYRGLIKNAVGGGDQALLTKFETLVTDVEKWLPLQSQAAKTDSVINKQVGHLRTILSNSKEAVAKIKQNLSNPETKKSVRGGKKTILPTATDFLTKAGLKVGDSEVELNDIIKRMEELEDNYDGGPSLRDRMDDVIENGVGDYAEFKAIYDARLDKLYSIRLSLQRFLKKNKGLFSQVLGEQKKRLAAINTLYANIEQEIANSASFLVAVKLELTSVTAVISDPETSKNMESMAMLSGETTLDIFDTLEIIGKNDHKTLGKGLDKFKKMLADGLLNVGNIDQQLLSLYKNLGNNPSQQALDLMFAPDSPADKLIKGINFTAQNDFFQNALTGLDNDKYIGFINDSEEVLQLVKMFKAAKKASFSEIDALDVEYKKIEAFLEQQKAKLAKMQPNHPQFEYASTEVSVLTKALNSYDKPHSLKIKAKNIAVEAVKDLQKNGSTGLIQKVAQNLQTPIVLAFCAFAKSEFSIENIEAIRYLNSNIRPDVLVKDYMLSSSPKELNIPSTILKAVVQEANQLDNPTVAYTIQTVLTIPMATLKLIFAPNTTIADKLWLALSTNINDTVSRFLIKSDDVLYTLLCH
jgi:hypothetical protein